jgi:hypothetical protein
LAHLICLVGVLLISIPALAEEKPPENPADAATATVINKLIAKLIDVNGKKIPIGVVPPMNYNTGAAEQVSKELLIKTLTYYGSFEVRPIKDTLRGLTLEEFRRLVTTHNFDVVIATTLKPTNFDIFLFDRRTPYFIYAYSATFPEQIQYKLTPTIIEEYTKSVVRHILFSYSQNEYYELPRAETSPVLQAEIPRWIASPRTLASVNHDIISNNYLTLGVGGAVSLGDNSAGSYDSNLVNFEYGRRVTQHFFLELAADMLTWNAFSASVKYLSNNRDNIFNYALGLGAGLANNSHTLADNPNIPLTISGNFVVASATILFPILEVQFKLESKLLVGLQGGPIVGLAPGFSLPF